MIYFAGPLFCEAERQFNQGLADEIEALGYEVFLPQRDGIERDNPLYKDLPAEEKRQMLFDLDSAKVMEADIFLLILDGRVPDEGACMELGIAYCHKRLQRGDKALLGLMTDSRAAFIGGKLNPMVGRALDTIFYTTDELLMYLDQSAKNA